MLVHLDDVVVFSKSPQDHVEQARRVLRLLYEATATFTLKKYYFFAEVVVYLAHLIRPGSLELAGHTSDAAAKLEHSSTQMEWRSFLRLCNVFERLIPSFARLAAPLNKTLRKDQSETFGFLEENESTAVKPLNEVLLSFIVPALTRTKRQYTLDTDVFDEQVGGVLLQKQEEGSNCHVSFLSRTLDEK